MRYGEGFVVERGGTLVNDRRSPYAYPSTRGFEYADGDRGDMLVEDFTCIYQKPGTTETYRITVVGNAHPLIRENSFDFDFASIDFRALRALSCDKADYRIRTASLLHDILFCVHDPAFPLHDTNVLLREVIEAYSGSIDSNGYQSHSVTDAILREKVYASVVLFGKRYWDKTDDELLTYRRLFKIERIK